MTRSLGRVDTKFWRAGDLDGAEWLRGRFADYSYDLHTHDKACFALITRGALRIWTRGSEFIARAGDLYAIDADEPHAGWPIDGRGWSLRTLYADIGCLQGIVADGERKGGIPAISGPIIRDSGLNTLFRTLHLCSETQAPSLFQDERCIAFVSRLFERHTRRIAVADPQGREPPAIRRAREFLDENLDSRVRLADIAAAADLPPYRLYRAFLRTMGLSPHDYQRQARLHRAARLIRLGQPLGEVAAAAGYADQAHMTRSFRQTLGVTPGTYRDAFRHPH